MDGNRGTAPESTFIFQLKVTIVQVPNPNSRILTVQSLSQAILTADLPGLSLPAYDRAKLKPGIVHIGVGNFHRTHLAVYVDRCLHLPGNEAWGILGIGVGNGPGAAEKAAAYAAQDGLYTVTEYDPSGAVSCRVIGAMIGYIHGAAGPQRAIAALACSNGAVARKAFMGFAEAFDPATAEWMSTNVSFPDSMVDRIAPSVGPAEAEQANARSGVNDRLPATAESFIQWVVEDHFIAGRPDFAAVGVQLRPDVKAFEAIKGRMLNASHMIMSYPSVLLGHRLVDRAIADTRISTFMLKFLNQIAMPLVTPPSDVSKTDYRDMILARFSNAAVGDQMLRVAHDGLSKLPTLLSASTRENLAAGADPSILAFHLACFRRYFGGRDDQGAEFAVNEPHLSPDDAKRVQSSDALDFLGIAAFAPLELVRNPQFSTSYLHYVERIGSIGVAATLDDLLDGARG
jgi:mannitol-1-phosphate/altronate dehydrogenase